MKYTGMTCGEGHPLDEAPDLTVEQRAPCQVCGSLGRRHSMAGAATVTLSGSIEWEHRHVFTQRNLPYLCLLALVTIGAPLVGLIAAGWAGIAIGFVLGVIADVIGFKAMIEVHEIERGSTK